MRSAFFGRPTFVRLLAILGAAVLVCVAAAVLANLTHDVFFHSTRLLAAPTTPPDEPAKAQAAATAPATTVTLPEGKLKAAGIRLEPAEMVDLPVEVVVAGTIEPNPIRRVEVRPRAAGIVRAVHVAPAQKVKAGEPLALLDSADVGTARLNLRARQFELSVARTDGDWKTTVAANVEAIVPELRKGTPAALLEQQFRDKPLGSHRAELLAAYADLEIASHEETKQTTFYKEELVGEHPAFVAMHMREAAQAKFEAALEQVRFDAGLQKRVAEQQVRKAEASVIDAIKRLQILGVNEGTADPLAQQVDVSVKMVAAEDVTAYPLTAPFDGTIISMNCVFSQRAELPDVLFTLADVSTVRVVANLPETDLAVLPELRSGQVRVTAAAYPGREFVAKMLYSSPTVDPSTRRVSLVAETANLDGSLKLGMFVRIHLDSTTTEHVLAVPAQGVIEIEGRKYVFVSGSTPRTFLTKAVTVGRETAGRQVITAGLAPGTRVVTAGAFVLKSELLLQNQTEED